MKNLWIILAMLSFNAFANNNVFELDCQDQRMLAQYSDYINQDFSLLKNIKEYRDNRLMLKNAKNFEEIENFVKEDNNFLARKLLMIKLNDGVNNYKICKNNNTYALVYEKNLAVFVDFFNEDKKFLSIDF